ncbi:hypothetical protein GDO86_011673 [Hymenochirus boettgeri]|uniref:Raftlin n=1 Tax=Hymenochirus boettgeri TaxID=247094 RepID=A0A8T2JCH3_9PIPI|nr:hypothetical protein GDO86_011673 [Hymenochirus boettgeri]
MVSSCIKGGMDSRVENVILPLYLALLKPNLIAIRLTSLRDIPAQLHELYQQGFTVAAIHPFVQSYGGAENIPQEQIFRAVLIKKIERNSPSDLSNEEYRLEMELCSSPDQPGDEKMIPDLVKRIEDAATQGSKFAGIVQGFCTAPNLPHSPSDSMSHCSSPVFTTAKKTFSDTEDNVSVEMDKPDCANRKDSVETHRENTDHSKMLEGEVTEIEKEKQESSYMDKADQLEDFNISVLTEDVFVPDKLQKGNSRLHDNCNFKTTEVLAVFNKPLTQQRYRKYYTVNIPMKISRNGNTVNGLEANWLEYMSDHFRKGCTLVNAAFYLGMVNDTSSEFTDGVFIFEDFPEQDPKTTKRYDAIVVEQWTVLQGLEVHTDYMPLLNSLAVYGWQLTCVLSTPIVKTSRDGNVTTKQIVFLQRPALPHKQKKKEPKFQWRFSRDERHSKHYKKAKGNIKENQHREEKKELDRNRKNEELLKTEGPEEGSQFNHIVDSDVQTKMKDISEELVPSSNEGSEALQEVNQFPNAERVKEDDKEIDSECTEKHLPTQRESLGAEEKEICILQDNVVLRPGDGEDIQDQDGTLE